MQIVRRAKLYNFLKSLATNYIIKASVWPFFFGADSSALAGVVISIIITKVVIHKSLCSIIIRHVVTLSFVRARRWPQKKVVRLMTSRAPFASF
jgi:hypothetical protein